MFCHYVIHLKLILISNVIEIEKKKNACRDKSTKREPVKKIQ